MPQQHIDFSFDPTSGPLSGTSFISQTEKAINELGHVVITGSNEAQKIAKEALINSESAQSTANEALIAAQDASNNASQAVNTANTASVMAETANANSVTAHGKANEAYDIAVTADSKADIALNSASNSSSSSSVAITIANNAQSAADNAVETAQVAFDMANSANGLFTVVDEIVDADLQYEVVGKSFIVNCGGSGFPVGVEYPLFFSVALESSGQYATQFYWSASKNSTIYKRVGSIQKNEEDVIAQASWDWWTVLGGESGSLPKGTIVLWHGLIESIPNGWGLCNGENGTPDLRGKFVLGASEDVTSGETGGSATHSHDIIVNHTTATNQETTLTLGQIPSHNHALWLVNNDGEAHVGLALQTYQKAMNISTEYRHINATSAVGLSGGYSGHNHAQEAHSHTASMNPTGSLPPYYSLAYIMKL